MVHISCLKTLIVVLSVLGQCQCKCYQSFMTFCEKISDLYNILEAKTMTQVVIGDENRRNDLVSIDINTIPLDQMDKLHTLVIINTISELKKDAFDLENDYSRLETMQLYKNQIPRLRAYSFTNGVLSKMILSFNNIEYVHKQAFYNCEFKTIDLSHNKIELIEPGVYDEDIILGNGTKEMIFSHNGIASIGPKCLPNSLEILNLDYNKMMLIAPEAFKNLDNLQELTISHNLLVGSPVIDHMKELTILDLSYNKLSSFQMQDINKLSRLEVLDLSHNNIDRKSHLTPLILPKKRRTLQISLAFNWFRDLNIGIENLKNHYLVLYGNPWNCKCWEKIEKSIVENKFKRNKCDLEFFGHGIKPYCAYYDSNPTCDNNVTEKLFSEKDLEFFLKAIDGERYINCTLQLQLL